MIPYLLLIVALAEFLVGILVFIHNRRRWIGVLHSGHLVCAAGFTFGIALYLAMPIDNASGILFWARFWHFSGFISSITYLGFAYFWLRNNKVSKEFLLILAVFSVIFGYLNFFTNTVFSGVDIVDGTRAMVHGEAHVLLVSSGIFFYCWAFFLQYKQFLSATGIFRFQIKFILWGTLFPVTIAAITNFFLPVFWEIYNYESIGAASIIIGFFANYYAIYRQRFEDIRFITKKLFAFICNTALYTFLLSWAIWAFAQTGGTNQWLWGYTACLVILTVVGWEKTQAAFDRLFEMLLYGRRGDLLNRALMNWEILPQSIEKDLNHFAKVFKVHQMEFVFIKDKNSSTQPLVEFFKNSHGIKDLVRDEVVYGFERGIYDSFENRNVKKILGYLEKEEISAVVPLKNIKKKIIGFLLLKKREAGCLFSIQEMNALRFFVDKINTLFLQSQFLDAVNLSNSGKSQKLETGIREYFGQHVGKMKKALDEMKGLMRQSSLNRQNNPKP